MAYPKVKISDNLGNTVGVTDNKLDVNVTVETDSIDIGDVEIKGHTEIGHGGNPTISNSTAEQITEVSTPCKHVDIMAGVNNAGYIAVGGENVNESVAEGVRLYAGDIYSIDIDNLNKIYVLSSVDGEDIMWTYFN